MLLGLGSELYLVYIDAGGDVCANNTFVIVFILDKYKCWMILVFFIVVPHNIEYPVAYRREGKGGGRSPQGPFA